jgi:biotin carboxylase
MPRVLLVAATTGYQTRSFADAARRHSIEVTLATDRCHILEDPWRDHAIPIRFEDPHGSADALAAEVRPLGINAVIAVADRPTLVAALTAEKLGLPWHPAEAVAICRDKHRMREVFAAAGLQVPRNFRVPVDADARVAARDSFYPCVLKPLGLSASRGVIRADNPQEFFAAFERIRRILAQPEIVHLQEEWNQAIQIEQYIEGREFALEGLMTNGALETLAIFDKPDPLEGPFFEETIYVTPSRETVAVQASIVGTARRAVEAIGLRHGPVHAEMRVNTEGVWMLEIAARPIGGLCARALRFGNSLTLEDLIVLHAIGRKPASPVLTPPASGVMMIPIPRAGVYHGCSGIEDALAVPGITDAVITARIGQTLVPLPEGGSYLGFLFAGGDTPSAAEASLRAAHTRLDFEIFSTLEIIPS